jgi:energy-coupling factor transporter ATP-binding protein EcfA2
MAYDYSVLFKAEDDTANTWQKLYDDNLSLADNLLSILKRTVYLPHDFYDIVCAYYLLPSALCNTIPYLFVHGRSGSGKSTLAKIASYLHDCSINSSSDTFAGIRNDLDKRRTTYIEVFDGDNHVCNKLVEKNVFMVWEDIDANVFVSSPDLYRLFKFGNNKATDKIILSSKEVGQNLEFHCFCPKVFSSITPLHLDDRFKELRRRLIVIPCQRVEDLSEERRQSLGIAGDEWYLNLIDLDAYDWKGFSYKFSELWDLDTAQYFVTVRQILSKTVKGLTSQQRGISLDLLACGIASGVWADEQAAIVKLKAYWQWFKNETEKNTGLDSLLKDFIEREKQNAKNGNRELVIHTAQLRSQVEMWVTQGWLYERPGQKAIASGMFELGFKHHKGKWVKE